MYYETTGMDWFGSIRNISFPVWTYPTTSIILIDAYCSTSASVHYDELILKLYSPSTGTETWVEFTVSARFPNQVTVTVTVLV
jgi:hypothetical protein